jgi:hypothetical protein
MTDTSSQRFAEHLVEVYQGMDYAQIAMEALHILEPEFSDQLITEYWKQFDEPVKF